MGMQVYLDHVCKGIGSGKFSNYKEVSDLNQKWIDSINKTIDEQIAAIQKGGIGNRIGMLQMRLLIESRDVFTTLQSMYTLYHDYHQQEGK